MVYISVKNHNWYSVLSHFLAENRGLRATIPFMIVQSMVLINILYAPTTPDWKVLRS